MLSLRPASDVFKVTIKRCGIKKNTASLKNLPDRYIQLIKRLLKLFNNIMLAFFSVGV